MQEHSSAHVGDTAEFEKSGEGAEEAEEGGVGGEEGAQQPGRRLLAGTK